MNSVSGFIFFGMLTSRETFLQNGLPEYLCRELLWLQSSHRPFSRDQAFGVKSKVGPHMKLLPKVVPACLCE